MTTAASSNTGDYSEVFSKHAQTAQKQILLIDDQWDTSLSIRYSRKAMKSKQSSLPKGHGVCSGRYNPHFIIIHLTNPSRADISSLQGCCILAGGVPIIIAAPVSGNGTIIKALENVAPLFLSFPLGPNGIGKILHDLDMSDRGIDLSVCHIGRVVAW